MGITRDELAKDLIPGLNKVFGIDAEYNRIVRWLTVNHSDVFRKFDIWQESHTAPRNKHVIRAWLTQNHPELIPMIDLITQE